MKWVALFSRKVSCYRSGAVPLFSTSDNLMMFCSSLTWWPHQASSAQWTGLHMCTSKPGVGIGKIFDIVNIYPETCLWTAWPVFWSSHQLGLQRGAWLVSMEVCKVLHEAQQLVSSNLLIVATASCFGLLSSHSLEDVHVWFHHSHGVVDSECWVSSIRYMIQCLQDWFLPTWTTC